MRDQEPHLGGSWVGVVYAGRLSGDQVRRARKGETMRWKAFTTIAVATLALAGCGGSSSSDQQQVRNAFNTVVRDLANRNPAACNLFTQRYAVENTGLSSYSAALQKCRAHVLSKTLTIPKGLKVDNVKVKHSSATLRASAPGQGTGVFRLAKVSGQWKIDSVTAR